MIFQGNHELVGEWADTQPLHLDWIVLSNSTLVKSNTAKMLFKGEHLKCMFISGFIVDTESSTNLILGNGRADWYGKPIAHSTDLPEEACPQDHQSGTSMIVGNVMLSSCLDESICQPGFVLLIKDEYGHSHIAYYSITNIKLPAGRYAISDVCISFI